VAFEENDAFDLLHAAVPIAYCDFVLLDKKWRAIAEKAISDLRALNKAVRLATVFSGRPGELDSFLTALETWSGSGIS